jgi:hypothetical protein
MLSKEPCLLTYNRNGSMEMNSFGCFNYLFFTTVDEQANDDSS